MTETIPETWSERNKISIAVEGGNDILFEGITATTDIDIGDKDIETIITAAGGNLVKYIPQTMTTVTLEAYPIETGTFIVTAAAEGMGFFDLLHEKTPAQPIVLPVNFVRTRCRIAVLWTDDAGAGGAHLLVADKKRALRFVGCGFITSAKFSFTDGVQKWTIVMKCPPFKKDLTANVQVESCDATTAKQITDLASFTTSANW